MLESSFEKTVCKCIKANGGRAFKWVSPGCTGVPDRICVLPGGRVVFIEVKRPGEKDGLRPRQRKVIDWLRSMGCIVWRLDDKTELLAKSLLNRRYDGELVLDVSHTQAQLAEGLKTGKFLFHKVDGEVRVLDDVNTLVTLSDEKGEVFQSNQTVRVKDQIANDVAVLFSTRYLGTVPNDDAGRTSLWNDVCKILQQLNTIRAIEGFTTDAVRMAPGDTKKAVLCVLEGVNVVNVMGQLYMSAVIV